jgi:structural maintenance of chromosome 1
MANKIESLELENFKSYRGKHQIAFKRNFTSIIGPNGAGRRIRTILDFLIGRKK